MKHWRLTLLFIFLLSINAFSLEEASALNAKTGYKLLKLSVPPGPDAKLLKWGTPILGVPAVITYAVAEQSMTLDIDIGDCREVLGFSELQKDLNWDEQAFREELKAGFKIWEEKAGVIFIEIEDPSLADVVVGVSPKSSSITHARVGLKAENRRTQSANSLKAAALCLDANEIWTTESSHRVDKTDKYLSLRLVTAHEVGHILGLDHPRGGHQLMSPRISEDLFELGSGDIEGAQILYGLPIRSM